MRADSKLGLLATMLKTHLMCGLHTLPHPRNLGSQLVPWEDTWTQPSQRVLGARSPPASTPEPLGRWVTTFQGRSLSP